MLKRLLHGGERPSVYYLRTRDGLEIDLVLEFGQKLSLFEVKSTMTVWPKHADSLKHLMGGLKSPAQIAGVISRAANSFSIKKDIYHFNWEDILGA